jgi:peptide/nickel transport system permease protein
MYKSISIKAIWPIISKFLLMMALMLVLGFIVPRMMPGNPLTGSGDRALPPEVFSNFIDYYAPDQSIWQQFWLYLKHLARFDLGYSFRYGSPVVNLITGRLGWTLFLSLTALVIANLVGVPAGMWSALNSKREKDKLAILGNIVVQSVPVFLIALVLQLFIAYRLNWLPAQGAYTPGITLYSAEFYPNALLHAILPILAVTISITPSIFILTRNVVVRIKNERYVELAGYLNINKDTIKRRYILRNSLPEIISKLNINFVYAVAGAIFVEIIFSYPGLGTLTKIAVDSRDYPLIQGIFLFIGTYGITVNLIFEWLQRRLNPWQK